MTITREIVSPVFFAASFAGSNAASTSLSESSARSSGVSQAPPESAGPSGSEFSWVRDEQTVEKLPERVYPRLPQSGRSVSFPEFPEICVHL